jgi:D-3-phosphoglycerate dehydrogenase
MTHILLTAPLPDAGMERLSSGTGLTIQVLPEANEPALESACGDADVIVVVPERPALTRTIVERASRLRLAARFGAGYDGFDVTSLSARGIPLLITGGANAVTVAEHALYLMLALAKRGPAHDRAARNRDWTLRTRLENVELAGSTVLVVGFGRIGREVAKRCAAFDMGVWVYDPHVAPHDIAAMGFRSVADFRAALPAVDIVSLHLPLTEATRGLIGADEFAALRPSAFLINTARGAIVDESALVEALRSRRLAGAGLDVFAVEPPRPDNPLLSLDNVVLTPHTGSSVRSVYDRMARLCADNIMAALDGRIDRRYLVNPEAIGAWASYRRG